MTQEMHSDLALAKVVVYDAFGYAFAQFKEEKESEEYAAATFTLDVLNIKFRVAKITPTKIGQFVTLWKRDEKGITCAHAQSDPIDLYIISVRDNIHFGQFVFPKSILLTQGILSSDNKEGKRGFRVYPPWVAAENKQAKKTQQWQLNYFLEINSGKLVDAERVKNLYAGK